MKIAEITPAQLDETVEIGGRIVSVWDLPKGRKYLIQDESGKLPIILWANVLEEIPAQELVRVGAEVTVRGRVNEYKGELRVVPGHGTDVHVTAPADDKTRPSTPLGELASHGAGRSVWITAVITGMEVFSKGVKLRVSDGSGEAVVLLWQSVYDALSNQGDLAIDARLGIFGEINHFRDEWEIVPRSKTEIVVLEPAA
jgi:hypothetical protein